MHADIYLCPRHGGGDHGDRLVPVGSQLIGSGGRGRLEKWRTEQDERNIRNIEHIS